MKGLEGMKSQSPKMNYWIHINYRQVTMQNEKKLRNWNAHTMT